MPRHIWDLTWVDNSNSGEFILDRTTLLMLKLLLLGQKLLGNFDNLCLGSFS